ncbi:MAG: hypothetical protein EXR72_05610 [Myxococcales bacterium]|nr:hypothetical protein [Myxococcales bacterium]
MSERAREVAPGKSRRQDSEHVAEGGEKPQKQPGQRKAKADAKAADVAIRRMSHGPGKGGEADPDRPVRVLVTGYGSFMGIEDNPSAAMAEQLAKVKIPGAIVMTKVLPVTWDQVDAFVDGELASFKADIVIGMGFSAGHHEIKEFAVNHKSGADASGAEGGGKKIAEDGPDFLRTTLPVDKILADQKKLGGGGLEGVNHTEPDDDYLCNYIEYRELKALQNTGAEVGFLHISDVERDLPAIIQLVTTAVADVKDRRRREQHEPGPHEPRHEPDRNPGSGKPVA